MSGRKGIGVKADDLHRPARGQEPRGDRAAQPRPGRTSELDALARQIATAALRFFMVKATTNRVIAFDFDEALSFEGESGPYLQYSLVRAKNIRRQLREAGLADEVAAEEVAALARGALRPTTSGTWSWRSRRPARRWRRRPRAWSCR